MNALFFPMPIMPWFGNRLELRIDVKHDPDALDAELDDFYRRINSPGDLLYGIPALETGLPGLVFRYREADGEYYVYVEDVLRHRLAGYTVFNRLVEVGRRADRYLRAPHSKYAQDYQRRGIATAVYEWGLGRGLCLISGARQSAGANALWHALARRHAWCFADVRDKTLRYLGRQIDQSVHDALYTRMILLGADWNIEKLATQAGILHAGHDG